MGDAQEIGDPDRVGAVVFQLAQPAFAVGRNLQRVDDRHRVALLRQNVIQREPVVAGGFQPDTNFATDVFQDTQQGIHPGLGVFSLENCFPGLTMFIQKGHSMFMFGDIDPTVEHHSLLPGNS